MKFVFTLTVLLWSSLGFACWKINGHMIVHGLRIPVHQKFNQNESYSFMKEDYIVHIRVKQMVHYEVIKREHSKLTSLLKGSTPIVNEEAKASTPDLKLEFKIEHI